MHKDSKFAKEGHLIGASFTQSPEVKLGLPWGQSTDIWSFGTAVSVIPRNTIVTNLADKMYADPCTCVRRQLLRLQPSPCGHQARPSALWAGSLEAHVPLLRPVSWVLPRDCGRQREAGYRSRQFWGTSRAAVRAHHPPRGAASRQRLHPQNYEVRSSGSSDGSAAIGGWVVHWGVGRYARSSVVGSAEWVLAGWGPQLAEDLRSKWNCGLS